ncbi:hypothetical protein SO802_007841 [Lithocarpus litseifolius]|uniref:RBR-type E3 ubiquitin transferase n=1 Tax=Lithocarpus litseifolius TaxID=425828 RepID=A0AAW2DT37_9ROSI
MAQESGSPQFTCVDDFHFSAVFDENGAWNCSDLTDEEFAEELQLQEALMGCVSDSQLCSVPWHSGVDCEEFQRLNGDEKGRDDLIFRELAKEKKWRRCPLCKYYVERTEGCLHMTCRCAFQFCYGCGAQWTNNHGGCHRD